VYLSDLFISAISDRPLLVGSLSNLRVSVPVTAQRGDDVALNCSFNLQVNSRNRALMNGKTQMLFSQDDKLYAVKWYRGTHELYRYQPSMRPSVKIFGLQGYNISVSSQLLSLLMLAKRRPRRKRETSIVHQSPSIFNAGSTFSSSPFLIAKNFPQ